MFSRSPVSRLYAAWTLGPALAITGVGCLDPQQPVPVAESRAPVPTAGVEMVRSAAKGGNLSAMNLSGINISGMNLSAMNLSGMNMGGSNLSGMNLSGMNFGGTNLGGGNLGAMNLAASNLSGMNLSGMNLSGMNLSGMNLSASNLSGPNIAGTNLSGMNLSGMNLSGMNLAGPDSGRNIHGLLDPPTGMLYSAEDLVSPRSDQCIVMGFGSTAFARLLAQQTASARLSVALGRLPWGFAASAGGPTALDAWEAVVWGDRSYCTFVLAAPPGSSWTGVAGFIKAVFRWNAPLTQSIDISGIEASAAHDPTLSTEIASYTGMMNAASRFVGATIDELAFMAGELAFITATTNNQSVMVDFSSWVRDSSGAPVVLGNVESVNPPTYAESVYVVHQNPDGTVGVSLSKVDPVSGVASSYSELAASYAAYRAGLSPRPVPIRCGGALFLSSTYLEPLDSGKCDSGLSFTAPDSGYPMGNRQWAGVSGTTAPMNQVMYMPSGPTQVYMRKAGKPILSETYIFMWEPNHVLPMSAVGTWDSGGRAALGLAVSSAGICAGGQEADKAFDQVTATKWCATGTPSALTPRSLMYIWGASVPITSYRLTSAADFSTRDPASWTFQGCHGGCTAGSDYGWVTLDGRSGQLFDARLQSRTYTFTNSVAYQQYRLRVSGNRGIVGNVQLAEMELFGGGAVIPLSSVDKTENGTVSWTGTACSTGEQATRAFDNLMAAGVATRWCVAASPSATRPVSIAYSWNTAHVIRSYALTSASDSASRDPRSWTLQGCAANCQLAVESSWTTLDTRTWETFAGRNMTRSYAISNNTAYTLYRLRVTANNGDAKMQIGELQLF